jgi:DNA polymerase III subunit epsilon
MPNIMFIDFEASSLSENSWPIEVGLAWLDHDNKIRSAARLIKPHPSWDAEDWSERSAAVHKIPFDDLQTAEPAHEVAQWVARTVGFSRLISDSKPYDGYWLQKLMKTAGRSDEFEIFSLQEEVYDSFEGAARAMFNRAFANGHSPHRADQDAARIAQAWRAAKRKM